MGETRNKVLSDLTKDLKTIRISGAKDTSISSIVYDSRKVQPGSLFVAMRGLKSDGTTFIMDAVSRGAAAVVLESPPETRIDVPMIVVANARQALSELAWSYYDHPERDLTFTGITGTNGKTTTATILHAVLEASGIRTGLAGTLGIVYTDVSVECSRTTPESVDLAAHFSAMRDRGISHVVMEATSIGIDLERTWQLPFRVTVFTNLTRDHLDYHGSEVAYRDAKLRLFQEQDAHGTAIINRDDPAADAFIQAARAEVRTYSIGHAADYSASDLRLTSRSTQFNLQLAGHKYEVEAPLLGEFNVHNLLAVIASAEALGVPLPAILSALKNAPPVRGRAELVPSAAPFAVVVDYAHTPDALEKILTTLRQLKPNRIITLVGAGGDRDTGKRPLMAQTAFNFSDLLILTSDNPRSEDPEAILKDMTNGLDRTALYQRIADRRLAIETALQTAQNGDIVLIAGKGHETYQEIAGVKYPFDDRQVALECLRGMGYDS
jgi:UDP-N-acetylmuramoyl-L-alanyl-D-glutamate--2,6-diaminopimelate ligase